MKRNYTILGLSIAAFLAISVASISVIPDVFAKQDAKGQPDLVATLTAIGSTEAKGQAMFWFDDDSDPSELRYQIVLQKIKLNDKNQGQGFLDSITKIHIHEASEGTHDDPHLFNIIGPNHDENDRKMAGQTVSGNWDEDDVRPGVPMVSPPTKSIQSGTTVFGPSVIEALCTNQTDVNVHSADYPAGVIRGILEHNSDACSNLGY